MIFSLTNVIINDIIKGGDLMTFVDILDMAMYNGIKLVIATKERGQIVGVPHSVDDFETVESRLGYNIDIDEYTQDIAYIDEITSITSHRLKTAYNKERRCL